MMVEAVAEKETCQECGVDVRENTAFCYNCGNSIDSHRTSLEVSSNGSETKDAETQAALDELAARFRFNEDEDNKLAKAAAERREARVKGKKNVRYEWQPTDEAPSKVFLLVTITVTVVAAAIVLLTVFWK